MRDATYAYTIHDLKHLLIKFALEKSFSEDSGGGGRESNMFLIPYIMHMALYVINTSVSLPVISVFWIGFMLFLLVASDVSFSCPW